MKRVRKAAVAGHQDPYPSPYAATLDALAEALCISHSSVKNLRRDELHRSQRGYSIREAKELLVRRTLRIAHFGKGLSQSALDLKARKLTADADMAELEYAQARGEVVSRAKINQEWNRGVLVVKNRLMGLGRELAPHLTGRGPQEIRSVIDSRVFEILRLLVHPEYCSAETIDKDLNQNIGVSLTKEDGHEQFS